MGTHKGDIREVRERSLSPCVSPSPTSTFSCAHYFQVSAMQATDVQRLDSAIHQINHYQQISTMEINYTIHWIVIYPEDSAIQPLNNRDLMNMDSEWIGDKGYIQGTWSRFLTKYCFIKRLGFQFLLLLKQGQVTNPLQYLYI